MRMRIIEILIIGTVFFTLGCKSDSEKKIAVPMTLTADVLIPQPKNIESTGSSFEIDSTTHIYVSDAADNLSPLADYLNEFLGGNISISTGNADTDMENGIYLNLAVGEPESYELKITEKLIQIDGGSAAGVFFGIQTLRQLLPPELESGLSSQPLLVATGTISDTPEYGYRGMMLDVSRHFFEMDEVKRLIDLMSLYKLNYLHLHLSDDQGWRIEIKSWPNLTAHGGSTQVGGEEGGFYTQDQYSEIVQYAADRFITVVPEIDMPGHTNAALASYPELNCDGKARELYTGTEVGFSTLCTEKELTYEFVDDVVREISALTPGPYFHIGGDESHVTPLEDYVPFIERIQDIVAKYDKQVLGWDEIAHAKMLPNTVVQVWARIENAQRGLEQNAKLLMSPANKAYLDMQYDSTTEWGLHWAAYIEVDSAYSWDPVDMVPGVTQEQILGIEAPLWSETIDVIDEIEYMTFPRLAGYAEIGWTSKEQRSWDEYKVRLAKHAKRWDALDVNYYKSPKVDW